MPYRTDRPQWPHPEYELWPDEDEAAMETTVPLGPSWELERLEALEELAAEEFEAEGLAASLAQRAMEGAVRA